ncbi:hypothetical protein [Bacillus sp. P14.5]|uniref:hypothetical protein n=1 Tax=Bacillus sp. P14.5 TaxID=1983400 RepID=UPI000DE915D9|nr:hypothetical protein [Bacillus sp. P14.5]
MDDKSFEKRMKKLNERYDSMSPKTDVSRVIQEIEKEHNPKRDKRIVIHWPYAASFIGVLLIASILLVQMIGGESAGLLESGEQGELPAAEREELADEVESHYKVRRIQAIGILGLTEEGFQLTEMGSTAENYVSFNLQRLSDGDVKSQGVDFLGEVKESLDDMLRTPQQILFEVKGETLTTEEADQWVKEYFNAHRGLMRIYENEMQKYRQEWEREAADGQLESRDILTDRKNSFSDELIQLVEGATGNGISLTYSDTSRRFRADTDMEYITFVLSSGELPEVYLNVLKLKSLPGSLNGGVISTNWSSAGKNLLLYEEVLAGLPEDSEFREEFKMEYTALLRMYTKGSTAQPLFNKNGTLKEDIKESYEEILELHEHSETAVRILPYYQKLKENDFAEPDKWNDFHLQDEL